MNPEIERRYSDKQLKELIKLGPLETIDDEKGIEAVHENLGGKEAVRQMRDHIDSCLKCRTRIVQLAAR